MMKTPAPEPCFVEKFLGCAFDTFDAFMVENPATTLVIMLVSAVIAIRSMA